ncbi:MAG: hypothetical protein NZL93_01760, partial [Chthoniobacterales bacterium]|nr:hypothetical protein [Chthoniobacterales bacterium]
STLVRFLKLHILPSLTNIDLPLAAHARQAARMNNWEGLLALNSLAYAVRASRELRTASLQTGRRRLASLAAASDCPIVRKLHEIACENPRFGHAPVVWGAVCHRLPERATLVALVYQVVAGYCTAAPKAMRIGQEAVQRVLTSILAEASAGIDTALKTPVEKIGFFDPILDIASMNHEFADERLFLS